MKDIDRKSKKEVSYKLIAIWGRFMGSKQYYINGQIGLAREEGAPETAVYRASDGWVTVDEISNTLALKRMIKELI